MIYKNKEDVIYVCNYFKLHTYNSDNQVLISNTYGYIVNKPIIQYTGEPQTLLQRILMNFDFKFRIT